MDKELLKAAWVRAYRSFLQAIVAQVPAGFVVTPAMIQYFKISYIYVILAVIINAGIYGAVSFVHCILGGVPEVQVKQLEDTLYALDNDPHVEEEDDEEEGDE